jgi:hypothetical protein
MTLPIAASPNGVTRRSLLRSLPMAAASIGVCGIAVAANSAVNAVPESSELALDLVDRVIPVAGFKTETTFADSIQKMIAAGVLDPDKYRSLYKQRGALPAWVERLLAAPSSEPIVVDRDTAPYLLNLLWPLGLSTKTKFNAFGPMNTLEISSYASTAGWTLGKAENGRVYFNQVETLRLTDSQDVLAFLVATQTFRPCCDNATLFQDCNHGSALLGLIELSASQGATEDDLYWLALAANSYWFPDKYVRTALHFLQNERQTWDNVAPRLILSQRFSSLSGWLDNVYEPQQRVRSILPTDAMGSVACGT